MTSILLNRIWALIAERGRSLVSLPDHPDLQVRATEQASELLSERGEATGAARAQALIALYTTLSPAQRHAFHLYLARHFLPDAGWLRAAAEAYLKDPSPEHAADLAAAAESPRRELLARMNIAPGATGVLIKMREAVIDSLPDALELKPLEQDLLHLLSSWFNPGFLELRKIDWNTSAAILEKLIAYEAVHEIKGWDDLRRRLGPNRRCYAFFHPALPDEPIIFVEIALCQGLASKVAPLLNGDTAQNPPEADTAIFYSISNCQPGLRKISFGNFLIKHVVEQLGAEIPALKCFATLSPIPGFKRWLERRLKAGDESLLSEQERAKFDEPALEHLADALSPDMFDPNDPAISHLKPILMRLCARYLTASVDGHGPDDPVARFHLKNGARIERINWLANPSSRGLSESYGLMVNYRYDIAAIEAHHEQFVSQGKVVYSAEVAQLLKVNGKRQAKPALARTPE